MNQVRSLGAPRRHARADGARPSSLANAIQTALVASGIALLSTGAVYAQETAPAAAPSAVVQGDNSLASVDLTVVEAAAVPSAVTSAVRATDSAAITAAAASTVRIVNRGTIVKSQDGDLVGITAALDDARVTVINDGAIDVTSTNGGLADGIFAAGATTDVTNNGRISAMGYSFVAGIESQSGDSARIRNNGDIVAGVSVEENPGILFSHAYGIFSKNFGAGGSVVDNRGSITVSNRAYSTGIFAYDGGTGGLRVSNAGDISVLSIEDDAETADQDEKRALIATGIFASTNAPGANINFDNTGTVESSSKYRGATGVAVSAYGDGAKATVTNSGSITAEGLQPGQAKYAGTALNVLAGGDISVTNKAAGQIYGKGAGGATAIQAGSANGNIKINNAGLVSSVAQKYGSSAILATAENGRVDVSNSGTVIASTGSAGSTVGIRAQGTTGAAITNSGLIDVAVEGNGNAGASLGAHAIASLGDASVRNAAGGTVKVASAADAQSNAPALPTGLRADTVDGNATVTNAGAVDITGGADGGPSTLRGAAALSTGTGNATATNTGAITVAGTNLSNSPDPSTYIGGVLGVGAIGLQARTVSGAAKGTNQGSVVIDAPITDDSVVAPEIIGVLGSSTSGSVTLSNTGSVAITAGTTQDAQAKPTQGPVGMAGDSGSGVVSVVNTGDIKVSGGAATGARGVGQGGAVTVRNGGTITASGTAGDASGLHGTAEGATLTLRNTGDVIATSVDGDAFGILGQANGGTVQVNNSGTLTASSGSGDAYAILIRGGAAAAIDNSGTLVAGTAIAGGDGNTTIVNKGSIFGEIRTGAGNDSVTNSAGGLLNLTGANASFGAGDDTFRNQGTLILGGSQLAFGAGNNSFTNSGTIKVNGNNVVQLGSGSAATFTNNGLLDFVDGKADDYLTIAGNFAGKGNINLDVNLRAGRGDALYISGQTAAGTQQKLNVALLDGLPTSQSLNNPLQLVQVSGNADPKAFVAGQVLGVSAADFLKLDMKVAVAKEPSGNGGNYLLSITPKVAGLNAVGMLAATAALGVDNLLSSTTGNWRDRDAMIQASSAMGAVKGIVPWVRGFRETGGMSPNYMAGSFGQAYSAGLNQDNAGTEVGFNLAGVNGLSIGATVAKSEAKQYLAQGYGMDTLRGASAGLYATWKSLGGAYIDASVRGMQFDAYMDTVAGRQQSQGNAHMANLEAGRTFTLANGLNVEPQFQYTATTVEGMQVQGHQAQFRTDTAHWQRGRVGVSLWKAYNNVSGWNVTPYGQLSAVHTLDGTLNYNINRDYYGQMNSEGTHALVKLGMNANKGRFGVGSALNWQGGQLADSGLGAQVKVSYAW